MFERFTEKAIKSIMYAQEESSRLLHNHCGTEMILLGLMRVDSGFASQALKGYGLTLDSLRADVEEIIGRGSGNVAPAVPFTPRAKRLLENSWNEARLEEVNYVCTEHLLLGLLKETEISRNAGLGIGAGARALEASNISLSDLRATLVELVKDWKTKNPKPLSGR